MEWEAAAATTNLQNCNDGDPMINLPTTTNCSSSSNSAAGNMLYVKVMTDEQLETLRKQIAVYTTICEQLVEMHKTLSSHQDLAAGGRLGNLYCDPLMGVGVGGHKISARQRWTPTPVQLQILEQIFEQGNGTPTKQKIKEITGQLSQHGQISETNVYNWFQNRRARSKRKQLLPSSANNNNNNNNNTASSAAAVTASGGDLSEVDTEVDSLNDQEDILIKNLKPPSAASGAEMYNHSPHSHISASQFNYLAQSQSQTHSVLPNLRDEHITGKLNGGYNLFDQADRDDYRLPG